MPRSAGGPLLRRETRTMEPSRGLCSITEAPASSTEATSTQQLRAQRRRDGLQARAIVEREGAAGEAGLCEGTAQTSCSF